MNLLFVVLMLAGMGHAQVNADKPTLVQSNLNSDGLWGCPGGGNDQAAFCDNVTAGDLLFNCVSMNFGSVPVFSDSQGNSYTPTPTLTVGGGRGPVLQCAYAIASSSGSDLVTVSGLVSHYGLLLSEFKNISGTQDTFSTATTTTSTVTLTTTPITTTNGDLCLSAGGTWAATNEVYAVAPQQFAVGSGDPLPTTIVSSVVGLAGAQSLSMAANYDNPNMPAAWGMMTVCFKPAAIKIVTTAIPDGAQTTAYKFTMQAVGGAGAYTWSALSGLPGWATLSAAGVITGMPNASATSTINFQVTDGTHTTTRSLTLTTGAAFSPITLVQSTPFFSFSTTLPSVPGKNDLLIIKAWGVENNGSNNWILRAEDFSDSLGTVFRRVDPVIEANGGGVGAAPIIFVGQVTGCGADTITFNLVGGTGYGFAVEEWAGAQPNIEDGVGSVKQGFPASPISLTSPSLTTQVDGETVSVSASNGSGTTGAASTIAAPYNTIFATVASSINLSSAYLSNVAVGGYTATASNASPFPTNDRVAIELIGMRPALPASTCNPVTQTRNHSQAF